MLLVKDEFGLPCFDPEELIDAWVHLVADFFPRRQAHQYELRMLSGAQYLSKVCVFQSQLLNRSDECNHGRVRLFLGFVNN